MERIRLGLIGAGIIVQTRHLPALQQLSERFEIAGVYSRTEEHAREVAVQVGSPPIYTDYRRLLEQPDIEAVDIAVPIFMNYPVSVAAAEAGKHVLCEKPSGVNLAEAAAMMELPARSNRVVMIAENFRYLPLLRQAREWIAAGEIGKPFFVRWNSVPGFDPDNTTYHTEWRQKPAHPGGYVSDAGVHYMDAVRTVVGEVEQIQANASWLRPILGSYDTAIINMRLAGDVLGHMTLSWATTERAGNSFEIFGDEGTLTCRRLGSSDGEAVLSRPGQPAERRPDPGTGGFLEELTDFHRVLTEAKAPDMSLREAYLDFAATLAALESVETGQVVDFKAFLAAQGPTAPQL